jgi:Ca-activated chloride channel family protein
MQFLWPEFLWSLLAVPLLVLLYIWLLRRKKKLAVRYASLSIIKEAMGPGQNIRRHIPPALFLLAVAAMLLAASRPTAVVTLPSQQQTIILAMDVSGSMRATDVQPNRLEAAQTAAKSFLKELPRHVKVGIVAFAGSAQVAQLPTLSRDDLVTAIDRFQLQRATATGNAIVISLATIFPDQGIELAALQAGGRDRQRGFSIDDQKKEKKEFTPVAPGSYTSAAIIMLTDGQRTTGVDPLEAAKMAADRGVRVYTVGVGTVDGETIGFEGWSMRVRLDEETLKAVASKTNAEYFYAGTAQDLKKVYDALSSKLTVEKKETEISAPAGPRWRRCCRSWRPGSRCSGSTASSRSGLRRRLKAGQHLAQDFFRQGLVVHRAGQHHAAVHRREHADRIALRVLLRAPRGVPREPVDDRLQVRRQRRAHALLAARLARVRRKRRHETAVGPAVAMVRAHVLPHISAHALGRFAGRIEVGERGVPRVRDALGHQRFLRVEVVVEGPVREAGGFHDLAHAHAVEAALLEQARGLGKDLLVLFGGFRCWVSHVTSFCSGVLQNLG